MKQIQKKWRSTRQLAGYKALLTKAIIGSTDGATCTIDIKTALSLQEVIDQAMHTERNHEAPE